jgi:hypothetical protein
MAGEKERGLREHFVRGLGESTRHNSLAFGYSLALTGSFGVIATLTRKSSVLDIFLFGIGGAAAFSIANPGVTRMFKYRVEGEPPIVIALGTSFGFVSISAAIGAAALVAWKLPPWAAWFFGGLAGSAVYLIASALSFVLARGIRALTGRDRLQER